MKSLVKILIVLVVVQVLSGCLSSRRQLKVTVYSDPAGATIYTSRGCEGKTPALLHYDIDEKEAQEGVVFLNHITARWVSGASKILSHIKCDLREVGYNQQITITRPANVPNVAVDVGYALELERLGLLRRQTKAQEDANDWDNQWNALWFLGGLPRQ